MSTLRSRTIRLAFQNPDLRPFLLGILSQGASYPGRDMANQLASGLEWAGFVEVPTLTPMDKTVVRNAAGLVWGFPEFRAGLTLEDHLKAIKALALYVRDLPGRIKEVSERLHLSKPIPTDPAEAKQELQHVESESAVGELRRVEGPLTYAVTASMELKDALRRFPEATAPMKAVVAARIALKKISLEAKAQRSLWVDRIHKLRDVRDPRQVMVEKVQQVLWSTPLGPGGKVQAVVREDHGWLVTPSNRQREDHYGNGGNGGDSDRWNREYADPMLEAAMTFLNRALGPGVVGAYVGEKGHLEVSLAK